MQRQLRRSDQPTEFYAAHFLKDKQIDFIGLVVGLDFETVEIETERRSLSPEIRPSIATVKFPRAECVFYATEREAINARNHANSRRYTRAGRNLRGLEASMKIVDQED